MSDDYGMPSFRKSKGDKKRKARFGTYKKGGKYRATNVNKGKNDK